MIIAYLPHKPLEPQEITPANQTLLKEAVWIDLFSPSKSEETLVGQCIGLNVPTREDMVEIELSSRLYKENDLLFMTVMMIADTDSAVPKLDPVTCILTQNQFITVRYIEPQAFKVFSSQLKKLDVPHRAAIGSLIGFLEASVDSLADTLEFLGRHLDDYSKIIFQPQSKNVATKPDYRKLMQTIGANADLNTKVDESLVAHMRLISFFSQAANSRMDTEQQSNVDVLGKDISALTDHANFMSNKITFLLAATLGMVNIEQNNIIKIFSVAAVIFLPPTLIASIYGMNFHFMPELSWKFGYLFVLCLMVFSSWLPYQYFKSRHWL